MILLLILFLNLNLNQGRPILLVSTNRGIITPYLRCQMLRGDYLHYYFHPIERK